MLDAYYECHRSIEMARLGYLFANGGLSSQDAYDMIYTLHRIAGHYTLEGFGIEGVMAWARDRWVNADDVQSLAEAACERVWDKWSSDGEMGHAAESWAIDLIEEWAEADGIKLIEFDNEDAAE